MSTPLFVLILEDRLTDAELMLTELRRVGYAPEARIVQTEPDFLARLEPAPDVILADYQMPQFNAPRALQLLNERGLDVPFIVVTGTVGEETAVECVKLGAADYFLKDRLVRLGPAVASALEQKRLRVERRQAEQALHESEERYRAIFNGVRDAIFVETLSGQILDVNDSTCEMFGYSREELCGKPVNSLVPPGQPSLMFGDPAWHDFLNRPVETINVRSNGEQFPVEINGRLQSIGGETALLVVVRDITDRKRAEAEVRSVAKFPAEDSNPVMRVSAEGIILYANEASQIVLRVWQCAVGVPLPARWQARCAQALSGGTRGYLDAEFGDEVYAFVIAPIVEFNYVNIYATNITHRKRAEEALRLYAERLENLRHIDRALLEAQSLPAIAQVALQRIYHLIPAERASIVMIDHPTNEAVILAALTRSESALAAGTRLPADQMYQAGFAVLDRGQSIVIHDLRARAGESIMLNQLAAEGMHSVMNVPLMAEGQLIGVLTLASAQANAFNREDVEILEEVADQLAIVTQQARLHEQVQRHATELGERVAQRTAELARERERLHTILDAAGEGIVFTDVDGHIEYINPALERLTNYTLAEVRGQNPRMWKSGRMLAAVYEQLWQTILNGQVWTGELINRRKDDSVYDASLVIAPLLDVNQNITGFVGILRDITRQKELDRLKDRFVSNVSHELRTPLASIKLYVSLLDRGKPEKQAEYKQALNRETTRLANMIEDLLDISRIDQNARPLQPAATDLNQLLSQLIVDRASLAAENGLILDFVPDPALPLAWIDADQMTQVISNLLINAIHYTPHDGRIVVSTNVRAESAGLEDAARADQWVTFTIRDNGPGILPEDVPHLFERFYRGEVGRKASAPGTGLGLAICNEIVTQHGGCIAVESRPGQGAAFTVWLRPAK